MAMLLLLISLRLIMGQVINTTMMQFVGTALNGYLYGHWDIEDMDGYNSVYFLL
jgi:hypothetical protein